MSDKLRLSPSVANILLDRSPLHAWHYHRLLGGAEREATASMENGTLLHHLVLVGGDSDKLAIIDADDFRTKVAREKRDAARAEGKTPIIARHFAESKDAAEIIRRRIELLGIPIGELATERRYEWEADGVLCSGVVDGVGAACAYELKSTDDANPRACRRSIEMYGYHVQAAAYREATGMPVVFIFAESDAPHDVTLIELGGALTEIGDRRWAKAKRLWAGCLASGVWQGAGRGISNVVEASDYALSRDREEAGNE